MKRKTFCALTGPGLLIPLILVLAACSNPSGLGGDTAVTTFSLDGLATAPVRGGEPVTTAIDAAQYTGAVAWKTADGSAHSGPFAASTVYKAVITLTAKAGYTFEGVAANSFTYTGADAVANAAGSGVVTITFPATAAPGEDTAVFDEPGAYLCRRPGRLPAGRVFQPP